MTAKGEIDKHDPAGGVGPVNRVSQLSRLLPDGQQQHLRRLKEKKPGDVP